MIIGMSYEAGYEAARDGIDCRSHIDHYKYCCIYQTLCKDMIIKTVAES